MNPDHIPEGIVAGHPAAFFGIMLVLLALVASLAVVAFNRQVAVRRMRQSERAFRDLYENIGEGVFRSTLGGRMINANPWLVRLNGFATEAEMIGEVNDIAGQWYVDPGRREEIHRMLLSDGRVSGVVSEVYRYKTRERIWIEENTRLVRDESTGKPLHYDGTVREITETRRRFELQERYEKIANVISGCLYQHRRRPDGTSSMPYASQGVFELFGVRPEAVASDTSVLVDFIHPDDLARISASLELSARTLSMWQSEYRVVLPGKSEKWLFAHAVPEREPDGSTLWHGFITDVSERKRSEARIYSLAYFDPLTRLPNRAMLLDHLGGALTSGAESSWGALFFIDLDQFKLLNDTKGHHVGDELLRELALRLRGAVAAGDLVARLGGDEFVVLCRGSDPDLESVEKRIARFGESLLALIRTPFLLDGFPFQTTASIGVVFFRGNEQTSEELLMRADLAMYEAKAAGPGRLCIFESRMHAALEEKLLLRNDLRDAIGSGALALAYQAQIDGEGRCFGAEALLRWNHPVRGEIEPGVFLPLAETNGLDASIDQLVLATAGQTLARWRQRVETKELCLAVNISARQLRREGFVETVAAMLDRAGAPASALVLELTEHVMFDDIALVGEVMARLKAMGIRFALDDFGTGFSSLSHLKQLPIDTLKIDRSFIRDIEDDASDRAIVQTILSIAESLQLSVVAEGVETQLQALLLRQLGCHAFQGFLFARPMPLEAFEAYVASLAAAPAEDRRLIA